MIDIANVIYATNGKVIVFPLSFAKNNVVKGNSGGLVRNESVGRISYTCESSSSVNVIKSNTQFACISTSRFDSTTGIKFITTAIGCTGTAYDNFASEGECFRQGFSAFEDSFVQRGFVSIITVAVSILNPQGTCKRGLITFTNGCVITYHKASNCDFNIIVICLTCFNEFFIGVYNESGYGTIERKGYTLITIFNFSGQGVLDFFITFFHDVN